MSPDRTYSTKQVARITKCSASRIQRLDERGIVVPRMVANRRRYSRGQVLTIWLLRELRKKGIALARLRDVVPAGNYLAITPTGERHWAHTPAAAISHMANAPAGFHLVDVAELRARLEARA